MNVKFFNNWKTYYETPNDGYSYFFGYYDKSPLNFDNSKLLAHRVNFDGREVRDGDIAEVGYFDINENVFVKIDETLAWNWQQGSQLQWLPPAYSRYVIYNKILQDKFVSVIYDMETSEKNILPCPVYVIHPNGKEALSVKYERLYWCRPGYNYQNIKNKKWNKPFHSEDGIFRVDLTTGNVNRIISMPDVINYKPRDEFFSHDNWLEHMMYNPAGDRFMFFHRWRIHDTDKTRLFTADNDGGSELYMYPDVGFYSHADWKNNLELTIWSKVPNKNAKKEFITGAIQFFKRNNVLNTFIKPAFNFIRPSVPEMVLVQISNNSKLLNYHDQMLKYSVLGRNTLHGNGHISWGSDKKTILLDTYEDENSYRHLLFYDIKKQKINKIGKFYSHYNSCIYRADLHPRFSLDENFIVIDSAHNKKRKMVIIENSDG